MRLSVLILVALLTVWSAKSDASSKNEQMIVVPVEVFCTDGVSLFYVSANKEVISPPEEIRLRILREQDGMLILNIGQKLYYPVMPNVTPVFLSKEDKLLMLPDLEVKDASIGLQLPEGLQDLVHQILHQPAPPKDVSKVLTKAEMLAAGLVHRAEAVGGAISKKADKLQRGVPAPPNSHPHWRSTAQYARTATDKVLGVTTYATNLVGHTIERVGENVRTFLPFYKPQNKIHGEAEKKIQPVKLAPKLNEDMRSASTKALAKINEALRKSAEIVAESIKDNTVKVIQYNFGDDIAEAVEDMAITLRNTLKARKNMNNLQPESIARNTMRQIIVHPNTQPQYECNNLRNGKNM
ncbi:uncharacterized protein LOC128987183 isoform X1 [Macrosteles quadrilineatus]|uniref:uncharacterized protein LOC128987183 isoform X1 n=1 Tax=Macrosteles quadrilineatus TaxID=74068 RepID=UPI0023E19A27|nr:uncharacterized protein LOC128987183 isoform X1 [Macrosteles quadrilineatus]XP_054263898.1 uncharacterized protein LOC128987183 isoform X1 [Macrosteles quadrilineatus]